jgi:hypothetical protein
METDNSKNKKPLENQGVLLFFGGPDGTRTRDPRRDRAIF